MGLRGILLYSLRAAVFAAVIGALYALVCHLRKRKLSVGRLMGVMYIAALVQITVLRGGVDWAELGTVSRDLPQLVPLKTTLEEARDGLWPLVYHTVGNMGWFVPLGILLRRRRARTALLTGAALSAGIELMQFLLMTGAADVDDVILNAFGSWIGCILARCIKKNGFD